MKHSRQTLCDARNLASIQAREMSRLCSGTGVETVHYAERLKALHLKIEDLDAGIAALDAQEAQANAAAEKGTETGEHGDPGEDPGKETAS